MSDGERMAWQQIVALTQTYEENQEEIQRLRHALREILAFDPSFSWKIAREALEPKGKLAASGLLGGPAADPAEAAKVKWVCLDDPHP